VKLLLFDIDGTLILTGGAGVRALNRAFKQVVGIDNAMDGIRPHGKTDFGLVREVYASRRQDGHSDEVARRILDAYVGFLPEEVRSSDRYRVLPGILTFLVTYGSHPDLAFGLATGNVERGARIKLERGNLNSYFSFGGFGSDAEHRAHLVQRAAENGMRRIHQQIEPHDVFVIGDTPLDIAAGREAGFRTVGVATSDYTRDHLETSGADLVMSSFEENRDSFLRLVGLL
jgi:phosphoglycolate phosphatase-like HAD superfamily hydrolase